MKISITKATSRLELAALITAALKKKGLSATLVGGAVVSLYTENRYESEDLDFISDDDHGEITDVMLGLGFKKNGKDFEHPNTELFVEFPSGPIAIGNKIPVEAEGELAHGRTIVKLLSPTQCVMDRLAAWYHWNDTQSLEQALMVAESQPIKIKSVELWSKDEGQLEKFGRFLKRYNDLKKRN